MRAALTNKLPIELPPGLGFETSFCSLILETYFKIGWAMYTALSQKERAALSKGTNVFLYVQGRLYEMTFIGWENIGSYSRCLCKFQGKQIFVNSHQFVHATSQPVYSTPLTSSQLAAEKKAKLIKWIRALEFKTVANGCEPGEAKVAAEKLKELRAKLCT